MDYTVLRSAIASGQLIAIDTALTEFIRRSPNDPEPLVYAAHHALCQGQPQRAKVLAEKALSLVPDYAPALIEFGLINVYLGDLEQGNRVLKLVLLSEIPETHPAHLAYAMLVAIFDESAPELKRIAHGMRQHWGAMIKSPEIIDAFISLLVDPDNYLSVGSESMPSLARNLLGMGDQLIVNLFGKLCQLVAPSSPSSFLAVGIIDLHQGFLESAGRALHEAGYRKTGLDPEVLWPTFALFSRQQRFSDALKVANLLISMNEMTLDGMGLYIDLLIRCHVDPAAIEQCLQNTSRFAGAEHNPWIQIAGMRFGLYTGTSTPEGVWQRLNECVELAQTAPGLFLSAKLILEKDAGLAKSLAERALILAPNHPEAANWIDLVQNQKQVFEYMGMFLPSEHEGCAWPNAMQGELLQAIFANRPVEMIARWHNFLERYELERLDAGCYRLLPLLHSRLTRYCPDGQWARCEVLKGAWKKSFLENSTRLKSTINLIKILEKHGIRYCLLKGLASAVSLYGDVGARPMSDIDILVHQEDLVVCHKILSDCGWQTQTPPSPQRWRFQYASTYLHPDGGNLDLHWRPAEEFTTDDYQASDLGEGVRLTWMGQVIEMLNSTTNLACTILHGMAWNHLSPVRWVCDSLLLLKHQHHNIDWDQFDALTKRYHFSHITSAGLQYLAKNFPEVSSFVPRHILERQLTEEENTLLQIRCRSRTETASFDDLLKLFDALNARFRLGPNDQRWVCGSHLSNDEIQQLAQHEIRWMPTYDDVSLKKQLAEMGVANCLLLDGNLNGYLRTVSSTNAC
jgi:Uncharacterised nucleotidyltransferase